MSEDFNPIYSENSDYDMWKYTFTVSDLEKLNCIETETIEYKCDL